MKPQCSGDPFCCAGRVAIGKHHNEAAKGRVTLRIEYAILTCRGFAQAKYAFSFGTKSLCKFRSQSKITCRPTGAKIDNHRVHLFRWESVETLVQGLKIGAVQRPEPQVCDVPCDNLAVERAWRDGGAVILTGQKHYTARQPHHQTFHGCPIQLRVSDCIRIHEIALQQCDDRLQISWA